MMSNIHTFAICAYKQSPYLGECIQSLIDQTIKSDIILVTSTPNKYIEDICKEYDIPYYINEGEGGITQDWNYAYSKAHTPIVTITHQDDIYYSGYTEELIKKTKETSNPLIFFSDYCEIRNDEIIEKNKLLNIKRVMLFPLRVKTFEKNRFIRRRILSFGSPICCPSVAYFKKNLPEPIFLNHFRTNEDWETWERISKLKGEFLYSTKILMGHRIHEASETTAAIQETGRTSEDYEMYCKFWPKWIAKVLCSFYKKSENSNGL